LAKGRITDVSRFATPNVFVWSWPPFITWFLGPVSPKPQYITVHQCNRHRDIHTYHATCLWCCCIVLRQNGSSWFFVWESIQSTARLY